MAKRSFGELELSILHILKSGKKMTVKQVHQILGEENKYNTIMTVMMRLSEKKVLSRERVGLQYEYWLVERPISQIANQFKKKMLGIKPSEMICYLVESASEISDEEFSEMEKMLEIAKQKRSKSK
jgi:predicted transcriptional regulator